MPGAHTNAAETAPRSHQEPQQQPDSRVTDAPRKVETLSTAAALQVLRLGGRLLPGQAAMLSHTVGNHALEELLSAPEAPQLMERSLPAGTLRTPPLSVPDNAPEAPVLTASPAWSDAADGGM